MSQSMQQTRDIMHKLAADLPVLVGPAVWPGLEAELAELDAAWNRADDAGRAVLNARYVTALANAHPAMRPRLAAALGAISVYESMLTKTAALLEKMGDPHAAEQLRQLSHAGDARYMKLKPVGEPTTSVKLRNIEFDFGSLSLAAAGILSAIATLSDPTTSGLAAGAAVLLILNELYKMMTREVSIDDASVYWGLIEAGDESKTAHLEPILIKTNAARTANHLEPLTETELRRALLALERLRAVAAVAPGIWRVVEEHGQAE